jgi:hypothetical protein
MTIEEIGIITGIGVGVVNTVLIFTELIQARKRENRLLKEAERKDRLTLLVQVILDRNVPIESRQPFYDEYIQLGGNSTVVKFWLEEKTLARALENR